MSQTLVNPDDLETIDLLKQHMKEDEDFKRELTKIALIIKASKGLPIDPDSIITQLTDIKNILERTRFPTYPILAKHVYLRMMAKYILGADSCLEWSKEEASALISYKGQSRSETVEMNKAPQPTSGQQFYLNERTPQVQEGKRHFWSRGPKKEESEFNE
jgi:hypothetical protein